MQARVDSVMEVVTNTSIGLIISTIANALVIPAVLGVRMTHTQNVVIAAIFTALSLIRGYALRRAFNDRSPWQAIKALTARFGATI
jgi:hypothetical protein